MMTKKDSPVPALAKSCGSSGKLALVALTHRTPANVVLMENIIGILVGIRHIIALIFNIGVF